MATGTIAYQLIRDLPFPASAWFTKKHIEETLDYMPHDDDIIIASYPKTGTTWLGYIVLQIVSKGEIFPSYDDFTQKVVPYMEKTGSAVMDTLEGRRIYKHHVPYNMVKKNDKAKCIYIYRNPEDTFVSYYHFMRNLRSEPVNINLFFEDFLAGNIPYGSYFKHVQTFFDHKDDKNLLLISYEKLHVKRNEEILRVAKFLGDGYVRELTKDESLLQKIVDRTSFENMKKNLNFHRPLSVNTDGSLEGQQRKVEFFRKGVIGDGKNSLQPDQRTRLRKKVVELMKEPHLFQEWIME